MQRLLAQWVYFGARKGRIADFPFAIGLTGWNAALRSDNGPVTQAKILRGRV